MVRSLKPGERRYGVGWARHMGLLLSALAYLLVLVLGHRSLGAGFAGVLGVGYFYGILRANFPDGFSHFIFDAAVLGLYTARFVVRRTKRREFLRSRALRPWLLALLAWPCLLFLVPSNHPLVQLVGLRAAVFFLPVLYLAAQAEAVDLRRIAITVAVLDLVVLAVALGEFWLGLERFYPVNHMTTIIYGSRDVAGHTAYRIPGTFANAHAYGMAIVSTAPFLVHGLLERGLTTRTRTLLGAGLGAAMLGVFLCGARTPAAHLAAVVGAYMLLSRQSSRQKIAIAAMGLLVLLVVSQEERMQRFVELGDTQAVELRLGRALGVGLDELLLEYPLGAGLGGGYGTSIPSFVARYMHQSQVGGENEFARLIAELGIPGLLLWLAFLAWTVIGPTSRSDPRERGPLVFRIYLTVAWGTAFIGTGLLTYVPTATFMLFQMGYLARARLPAPAGPSRMQARPAAGARWPRSAPALPPVPPARGPTP